MVWLQENWIIAVVGLVVAVVLLWWLFGRKKPEEIAPPAFEPAKPAKPLEPVKPDIVAAEPARFKPREPVPSPTPPPAVQPVAKTAPPAPKADIAPAPPKPAPAPVKPAAAAPEEPAAAPPAPEPRPETPRPAAEPAPAAATPVADEPAPPPAPAPAAKADNLQLLKGVGPKLVALLNGLGVTSFAQIAAWTDADIAAIDPQLGAFQGRIARDNLVDQASYLARGDKGGFEAKYGALGGEL